MRNPLSVPVFRRGITAIFAAGFSLATAPLQAQIDARTAGVFLSPKHQPQRWTWSPTLPPSNSTTSIGFEFTGPLDSATFQAPGILHGVEAASIGGWFFLRREGEQVLLSRGLPETAPGGERVFRPAKDWVNFFLGTDQRGFLMGGINGNGRMPFPLVTLSKVAAGSWHQLVLVKDAQGIQRFYHNGVLAHSDVDSEHAGVIHPFRDVLDGHPLRVSVPLGGQVGEAWVYPRALTEGEIRRDFAEKRGHFSPALPVQPVQLREMNAHPDTGLWPAPITAANWPKERERIHAGVTQLLGPFPTEIPPLEPRIHGPDAEVGTYIRRKVSIQVQPNDRMPAWLLIPKTLLSNAQQRAPAILCFYGTTSGAGKDTTVGLSGSKPGSSPARNRAFAIDMATAGYVTLAPDFLRDGERLPPSGRAYDTTDFYRRFPEWSCVGKDIWDTMRAIDYLQTLSFVETNQIGMVGHSYGGHTTIFAAALEPRIRAVFSSGPVSDFRGHGLHWAVPKGAGNSQSLPHLRPFVLDHTLPIPAEFYEWTALIAPRPLWVNQAVGERRPHEEENHAAVKQVYQALALPERVRYMWSPGDHDFPPAARAAAVAWFERWLGPGIR